MKTIWLAILAVLFIPLYSMAQGICTEEGCAVEESAPASKFVLARPSLWPMVPDTVKDEIRNKKDLTQKGTVVVLFSQNNCEACDLLKEALQKDKKMNELRKDEDIHVYEWNVSRDSLRFTTEAKQRFKVVIVPSVAFFKDGAFKKFVTITNEDRVKDMAAKIISCTADPQAC